MPANDFAPPGAAGNVHLLKSATLKKLRVRVEMDPTQFTCVETPETRTYTYIVPPLDDPAETGDDFDLVDWPVGADEPRWTLYFRGGLAYVYDPGLGDPERTLYIYDAISNPTADGP